MPPLVRNILREDLFIVPEDLSVTFFKSTLYCFLLGLLFTNNKPDLKKRNDSLLVNSQRISNRKDCRIIPQDHS